MKNIINLKHNKDNSLDKQNKKIQSHLLILWVVALISLPVFGCGTALMGERNYETPDLPKSKLANIQIDTKGQWIEGYDVFSLSVNGKRAFHEKIIDYNNVSIDDVLVVQGKHEISLLLLTQYYPEGISEEHQTVVYYSINVKAGSTYLLKGYLDDDNEDKVNFELIDIDTDQVVSEEKTSRKTTYQIEDSEDSQSIQIEGEIEF